MRNETRVTGNEKPVMHDTTLKFELNPDAARKMANKLLDNEFRGRGDTFESAFFRIQTKYGVSASLMDRLTSKCREINDMKLSSFAAIASAYQAACSKVEANIEHERATHEHYSIAIKAADFVGGQKEETE